MRKVSFIHHLRGLAALLVVFAHFYGVFWTAPGAVAYLLHSPQYTLDGNLPFLTSILQKLSPFNLGAFGVAIFFLISGFVISISIKKYNTLNFLLARVVRIYPTYLVGFAISSLVLFFYSVWYDLFADFSVARLVPQFLLIRDWLWLPSLDGISWTLEIELKFYILCALLSVFFKRNMPRVLAIIICTVSILWAVCWNNNFFALQAHRYLLAVSYSFPFIVYMFIGVIFFFIYSHELTLKTGFVIIALLFINFLVLCATTSFFEAGYKTYVVNYGIALVIFSLLYLTLNNKVITSPVTYILGNISYSLYVIHPIVGYAAMHLMLQLGVSYEFIAFFVTLISIFSAYLLHRFVELPSHKMAQRLSKVKLSVHMIKEVLLPLQRKVTAFIHS
ncbi:acyltransferase family protein [Halodesulfovibrio aestuarii]|uniref:acyltransferase family protein n=1 Tax=Halodesulfovibrio aestuarii TaxID=126333 RepID=UPI003D325D19